MRDSTTRRFLAPRWVPTLLLGCVLAACSSPGARVAAGSVVRLHYTGTTVDGIVFDSTKGGQPLEFTVGDGRMLPAMEKGIMGLKAGDSRRIDVKAADAFGESDPSAIETLPRTAFPREMKLEKGARVTAQGIQGPQTVTVVAVDNKGVTVDLNNPLAGKDVVIEVQIISVRQGSK